MEVEDNVMLMVLVPLWKKEEIRGPLFLYHVSVIEVQEKSPHQELNLLTLWFWTSQAPDYEK